MKGSIGFLPCSW